jgi:hypothetical protein
MANKVVYLFGAGASKAEAATSGIESLLSLGDVSEIVINKARKKHSLRPILDHIGHVESIDIEHYISLLESLHNRKYETMAETLRSLFCETIQSGLADEGIQIKPSLEMALMQIHGAISDIEEFEGAISLNYDSLLDQAFNEIFSGVNYGIKCKTVHGSINYNINTNLPPLIKLHGSFNWRKGFPNILVDEQQAIDNNQSEMLWIPPSVGKTKDIYPFNSLWGKAFELLDCDILRIVGCKLNQNDWGVISLLFDAQLRSDNPFTIELITSQKTGLDVRKRMGFLKNILVLEELPGCKDLSTYGSGNTFESWLKRKISGLREKGLCTPELDLGYVNQLMEDVVH